MTVRRAQSCDLAAIHELESACFSDPWSEEALRNAFGDGITEFAVIEDGGADCGCDRGRSKGDSGGNADKGGAGASDETCAGTCDGTCTGTCDGTCDGACDEKAGGVFGYAMFSVILEDAEVMSVAVATNRRGCGAGRTLMNTVLARAAERGATQCFLEVRSSNVHARALYASLGFTEVRTIRSYYRHPTEDAVVMSRTLP